MPTTVLSFFEPVIAPVTWAMVHFLWQGGIVAAALAAILALRRRSSAASRYRFSCCALLLLVALPVLTVTQYNGSGSGRPAASQSFFGDLVAQPPVATGESLIEEKTVAGSFAVNSTSFLPTLYGLRPWIFVSWLAGVLVLSVIHVTGWRRIQRLKTFRTEAAPAEWQETAERLCVRLGIRRAVRILTSACVQVPTVIGWLSPVVLIPLGAFTGMHPDQLRSILIHELAHIQRRDYLVNLLQVVAETLLFFHPAVWWVSRQIRRERELCCDDVAVALTESRATYVRALVCLEELRYRHPDFALRADGGSLSRRVRRLAGGHKMQTHRQDKPRLTGVFLTSLLILCGSVLAFAADRFAQPSAAQAEAAPFEIAKLDDDGTSYSSAKSDFTVEGRWEFERVANVPLLRLESRGWNNRWNFTVRFEEDEFENFGVGSNKNFELRREAGTLYFTGDVDRSAGKLRGDGKFGFVPDPAFIDKMKDLDIKGLSDEQTFSLAARNVGTSYVEKLHDLGYKVIGPEQLFKLAIHDVNLDFVRGMKDLGYKDLSLSEMVKMRIHGVSTDYVREMRKLGYGDVSADGLVKWRIHGVDPEYVREMSEAGFDDLSSEELVTMRIHGVTPEFADEMAVLGYKTKDIDQLVKWKIHGVTPEFVREMKELGLSGLTRDSLVKMRIHGVTPEFVKRMSALGYEHTNVDRLVKWKIHGVTPGLIEELEELGYSNVDSDDLVRMRIHGVTPRFIEKMNKKTTEKLSIDDLVKLKIHGIYL